MTPTTEHPTPQPILPQNVDFAAIVAEEKAQSNPYNSLDLKQPHKLILLYQTLGSTHKGKTYLKQTFKEKNTQCELHSIYTYGVKDCHRKLQNLSTHWGLDAHSFVFKRFVARTETFVVDAFLHRSPCGWYVNIKNILQWRDASDLQKNLKLIAPEYPSYTFFQPINNI